MFGPDMNYEPLAYEPLAGADESPESSQHFSVREGGLIMFMAGWVSQVLFS